jgi:hypothetical protein
MLLEVKSIGFSLVIFCLYETLMPQVIAKPDNLNELNKNYQQTPLKTPLFLNSVPKCGTHLVRNIFRMFVPVEQQYHKAFIQIPLLRQNMAAYSPKKPQISWGHLLFSDESAIATKNVRHILTVRDPYDWVLARARFFLSDNFKGNIEHLKGGAVTVEQMLNMMIFGIYQKAPCMADIFNNNAVAWMGTGVEIVKYEHVVKYLKKLDTPEAETFFSKLLCHEAMPELPEDWKERVLVGSDRKQSGTARENLSNSSVVFPDELPDEQKRLVDYALPGLRQILGY